MFIVSCVVSFNYFFETSIFLQQKVKSCQFPEKKTFSFQSTRKSPLSSYFNRTLPSRLSTRGNWKRKSIAEISTQFPANARFVIFTSLLGLDDITLANKIFIGDVRETWDFCRRFYVFVVIKMT